MHPGEYLKIHNALLVGEALSKVAMKGDATAQQFMDLRRMHDQCVEAQLLLERHRERLMALDAVLAKELAA